MSAQTSLPGAVSLSGHPFRLFSVREGLHIPESTFITISTRGAMLLTIKSAIPLPTVRLGLQGIQAIDFHWCGILQALVVSLWMILIQLHPSDSLRSTWSAMRPQPLRVPPQTKQHL